MRSDVKLGKWPKRDDPRTLRFLSYATPALPAPPLSRQWGQKIRTWPMYANDTLGDCTVAAVGHQEQVWTSWSARPWTPNEQQVVAMYWATGSKDNGRVMLNVLNYWRRVGLAGTNKISAYVEVNPQNGVQVRQAINLFGGLYIGLNLPVEMQGRDHWSMVPGMDPGSWGGHAVNITAYTQRDLCCITWGQRLRMSWAFFRACCDEAYAVLSHDFSPALPGFDYASLEADLAQL